MGRRVVVDFCGAPRLENFPPPAIPRGYVLLRPHLVLKDGADYSLATCHEVAPGTRVVGTAATARVIDVGVGVDRRVVGQRVITIPTCPGHTPVDRDGLLAEEAIYPSHCIYPIPQDTLEDPLTLLIPSVAAILRLEHLFDMKRVLIVGCDSYALAATLVARRVSSEVAGYSRSYCYSREFGVQKVSLKAGQLFDVVVASGCSPYDTLAALSLARDRAVLITPYYALATLSIPRVFEELRVMEVSLSTEHLATLGHEARSLLARERRSIEKLVPMRKGLGEVGFTSPKPEALVLKAILGSR